MIATAAAGLALASFATAVPAQATEEAPKGPKNVIVLIGDGMGYSHIDNYNAFTKNEVHWQ